MQPIPTKLRKPGSPPDFAPTGETRNHKPPQTRWPRGLAIGAALLFGTGGIWSCDDGQDATLERQGREYDTKLSDTEDTFVQPSGEPSQGSGDATSAHVCQLATLPQSAELLWAEVEPDDKTPANSPDATASLQVTNHSDAPLIAELWAGGDRGTTLGTTFDLELVEIDPGETHEAIIDLTPLLPESPTHSSAIGVSAHLYDAATGALTGEVNSLPLYFHATDDGVALYNAGVLATTFGSGDLLGVKEVEPLGDPEDTALRRVVKWSPPPGNLVSSPIPELADEAPSNSEESVAAESPVSPGLFYTTPNASAPYLHQLCAEINVHTWDSGWTNSQGTTEDIWSWANDPGMVRAFGIRVKVGSTTYDTSPATGCIYFYSSQPVFTADVRGYAYFEAANGSYVRLHNGPNNSTASYPGSTYSDIVEDVVFDYTRPTFVWFGDTTNPGQRLWTGAGIFMMSLYRYPQGLPSNSEIHVSPNGSCGSTNLNYFFDHANNEAYIRMEGFNCSGSDLQGKFITAHEYGHALGYLNADVTQSPASSSHNDTPSDCSFSMSGGNPYGTDTKEWSSLAAAEGWAHFVSARVWNDEASDGHFRNNGVSYDLERWDASNTVRGYLKNECCPGTPGVGCPGSLDGAGTIGDWMRGYWDLHTHSCDDVPDKQWMVEFYGDLINSAGLQNDNFWPKSADSVASLFPDCEDAWDDIGCHNGLDQEGGATQYGSCP